MGILLKLNTYGVIFTIIVIVAIIFISIYGLIKSDYELVFYYDNSDSRPKPEIPGSSVIILFGAKYSRLFGI